MGKTHSPEQKASSREPVNTPPKVSLLARIFLLPIYFYRYAISPMLAPRCRFYPTCSTYAVEAIKIHGAFKGGYLAIKRILRCNPLSEGGEDPVPPCGKNCHHSHSKNSNKNPE